MENGKTLIVALVALIPVALWSATGIEVDESKSGAECQAPRAIQEAADFRDDEQQELSPSFVISGRVDVESL